ncbi:MAG: transporter substrate-binding domain-containing protein, partial [Clostridiales bacterium]|nr:transporter substrate-binding domain-containing protein [Clostridiales bacterium]
MKRTAALILCIALVLVLVSCGRSEKAEFDIASIQSYRDIPGVTDKEIAAVEALISSRGRFSYGQMAETEAFIMPDGSYGGFAVWFSGMLSRLFGVDFVLELYDWEELKSGVDGLVIDFTGDLTPTPERMLQYHMTVPIAERSLRVFQHVDGEEILTERDINGLRVGSLAGTIDIEHVREYYPELIFNVVEVESFEEAAWMLDAGTIDAFISEGVIDPLFDQYGFVISREFFPLVYTSVSLATANAELEPLIEVVNKYLAAGGVDELYHHYKLGDYAYARNKLSRSFTDEENAYIRRLTETNKSVKVALEQDNYPISFYNKADRAFQGIAVDVLEEISSLTGITFETVNDVTTPWARILEMLREGDASLVTQLLYSEERKGNFLWPDRPYASAYYALISKIDYPNLASYQVVRSKVGTLTGSAFEDKYNEWFPNNNNTVKYSGQDEILDALENGEIDLLMGSNYLLLMQQNYREKPGFKINIRFSAPMDSYFGFNKNETELCSIVSKAQYYVNTATISDSWTSRGYDYTKKMAQQRSLYSLGAAGGMCAIVVVVVYYLVKSKRVNLKLDKIVSETTADLRTTVAKLEAILSNYGGVIWSVDRNEIVTLFNGLYLNVIGVSHEFIEGKSLDAAIAKNRHMDIIGNVRQVFADGVQKDWVSDIDGRMYRSRITPIYDEGGAVSGVVGNTDDITESLRLQRELEIALEKAEAAVQAVQAAQLTVAAMFESNPQMNVLFSSEFKVIDCNPAAYAFMMFDSKKEMMEGFIDRMIRSIPAYQSDGRPSISLQERLVTAAKDGYAKFDTELVFGDQTRILDVELKRIPYEESFALVAYVFDMTEIKAREKELIERDQQLVEAVEEARAANQAKSAFLSNMSHEIRTPMNAILGITEIQLQNAGLPEDTQEAFGKIYNSGDLLLGIINDILDLSKIEAGKFELLIMDYRIASLINDTAQVNMMRIGSKPIEFVLEVDEHIPETLTGDELRVKQILNNILSNAFKYTAEGMVKLR